jgi:ribosomal protein L11 methyltransferase
VWIQAHVTTDKAHAEAVEALLEAFGALSITLADAADEPMFEPALGTTPLWRATRVTGLYAGGTDLDALQSAVTRALADAAPGARLTLEALAERDWARVWLEGFRPMCFGRRLWVCPSGATAADPAAVVVHLDPGLAFGTGTHPTTALCLTWLDGSELAGRRVIDFGCGSGILAVAAARLGAEHVTALDHDPQALTATAANAAANEVADRIDVHGADLVGLAPAEVVVANILANVLIELAPTLTALVAPRGSLVLSGILIHQADAVMAAYAAAFDFDAPAVLDDWVRLSGQRIH